MSPDLRRLGEDLLPKVSTLLIPVILLPLIVGAGPIPRATGLLVGVVCIAPSSSSSCPSTAASFTGSVGGQLVVAVNIQGSDALNGYDITVQTNSSVLRPVSASFAGSVLPLGPMCLLCPPPANITGGTVHVVIVAVLGFVSTAPTTGRLFSVTYNIVGGGTTSIALPSVTVANGPAGVVDPETLLPGRFGAVSGTTLTVVPASNRGIPGSLPITVHVDVANVANLVSYDVSLFWNASILKCNSISDTGTVFSSLPHAALVTICGVGFARVAETLLGTSVSLSGASSTPLFFVSLSFVGFGSSTLTIGDDILVDSSLNAIPHIDRGATASTPPPAQASMIQFKARPDVKHLSLSISTTNTFFADAEETSGVNPAFVRVVFTVVSSGGDVSTTVTPITKLAPAQSAILSATWTVPSTLPSKYFVVAQLQASGDSVLFINENSKTFSFTVVP